MNLDQQAVKNKTIDLVFALKTMLLQVGGRDRSLEGIKARELIEDALTKAIPDGKSELAEVVS